MNKIFFVTFVVLLVVSSGCAKRGFGGFRGSSSRGSGKSWFSWGKSSSSSGGSWFSWGRSKPAASPSYSSRPSHKSTGGAPPAYPGLQNRPVHHSQSPPAYSPSYSNPPAYSGYNKYTQTHNYQPPNYGTQFGRSGVGSNTYIHNNYYGGGSSSESSKFLTHALFYNFGRHHAYTMMHPVNYGTGSRSWSEEKDREWRATTQAPYFKNKVPGDESVLPAAAVIGAATAFGLTTLLPLNVPAGKPLMYCNSTFIEQYPVKVKDDTYSCMNGSIAISCPRTFENGTSFDECLASNQTLQCDLPELRIIHCKSGTLLSRSAIFCDSSTQFNTTVVVNGTSVNETETVLNCDFGRLPPGEVSFIPAIDVPETTTTKKSLSLEARMHVFFLHLIGQSDILDTPEPNEVPDELPYLQVWQPEALTIPPETTTTSAPTTTEQYFLAYKVNVTHSDGTHGYKYLRVSESYNDPDGKNHDGVAHKIPRSYFDTTAKQFESS